jgi:EpsI family protein
MPLRLALCSAVLLGIYTGVRFVRDHGMPTESAPLEMNAKDLPMNLGQWQGKDIALDPEVFRKSGAEAVVDRRYRNRRGQTVFLHLAVYGKPQFPTGLAHSPEICYPADGWRMGEPKFIPMGGPDQKDNLAKLLPIERPGETDYVLCWYQIAGAVYCTGDRQRRLFPAQRGRPFFPPVVKVMLQTGATNAEEAEKTLTSLAAEAYKWTKAFH